MNDFEEHKNKMMVVKLSEEHGWIKRDPNVPCPKVGDKMLVIPNHSCAVANLTDYYVVINKEQMPIQWKVDTRGCVR
jgi:D-serine deaminase-like pyridoxal phosphate-dependent protein